MDKKDIKAIAVKLFKEIKTQLIQKNDGPDKTRRVFIDADRLYYKGIYRFYIDVNRKRIVPPSLNDDEVSKIFRELTVLLKAQKSVRGWKNLLYIEDDLYGTPKDIRIIKEIIKPEPPCKDFLAIKSFIKKHTGYKTGNYDLYNVRMGGKRGYLISEYEGSRHYLANKKKKCADIITGLRKFHSTRDTVTCRADVEYYIDPEEQAYSEYHEIECDGEKRSFLNVTIKSPKGKIKYDHKIY